MEREPTEPPSKQCVQSSTLFLSMAELPLVRARGTTLQCCGSESLSDLSKEIQIIHR